ncbi:DMT family transporter [Oceanispirochaeta sp.]|jgi:drug/metabolite transporter (DMT)-like permease|uniref:DMT family transporter n=1 Tax=Oceanispirochaeta sp. TaxID=2035350 RepID=UPI002635E6B6|nr:DMT family transporter [Oceanispirochaeta sp.]MDA3958219.1 DMT family transporter [Oceanispirochaeta sp.]
MMVQKNSRAALMALTVAVILWGGSFSAMRTVLQELDPMSVMWLRMVFASVTILPFISRLRPPEGWKKDYKILIPMVLFQPCLYFLLESNALRLTSSSQAGVISSFVPLFVSLGAWLFLSEKLHLKGIAGLFLSISGVVVLTLLNGDVEGGSRMMLGNTMEVGAMICAAANMLIIKKLSSRYNTWTMTMMQCFAGVLFFLPGLFKLMEQGWVISGQTLLLLLYLGAPVSLGAFGLYNLGMSRMTASGASVFINLVPVVAVITGWVVLHETLSVLQIFASAAVLTGVLISQDKRSSRMSERKAGSSAGSKIRPLWSSRN